MYAFIFTLALFAFWTIVGFAIITTFKSKLQILQGILISPSVGIAATVLLAFFINRAGIPVNEFGGILILSLTASSALVLAIIRPTFPAKRLLPYIGILVGALVLSGWPILNYGFHWLSFSNDDMANYCLGAQRFLNHGFFDQPNLDDLVTGKDYSITYWFLHAAGGARSGSELMLAVIWAISGLNAHQIFMPVILALHLALVAGTGAMVVGLTTASRTSLIAMGLIAVSPLTSLGTLYQLIGQVGGLSLLIAAVTLTYRHFYSKNIFDLVRGSVPAALVISSIFIWYPEVLPFFGLGWMIYASFTLIFRRENELAPILKPALMIGVLVIIVLNEYVITAGAFLLNQLSGGMQSADVSSILFPYFLVPSGIAAFWGLIPIAAGIPEPFVSLAIASGLMLFYWLGRYVLPSQIKGANRTVSMLLVMLAMGVLLFYRNNDFGLFKLAMFAQPFLIGVIAIELGRMGLRQFPRYIKTALTATLIPLMISQYLYVGKSTGEEFGGLNDIPHASKLKVNEQFKVVIEEIKKNHHDSPVIMLDTAAIALAKFQSLYTNGLPTYFMSRDFFGEPNSIISAYLRDSENLELTSSVRNHTDSSVLDNTFSPLKYGEIKPKENIVYITTGNGLDIFNKYTRDQEGGEKFFSYKMNPKNQLVFIHSAKGNHYYLGKREVAAFYGIEKDPMFMGADFSALGRHLLFQAINPAPHPRLVMELTATITKQWGSELPKPYVENSAMNFIGRGSGRVFSEPLTLTTVGDSKYLSVDIGRDGKQFPSSTKGLMSLYGRSIPADQRRITAFGRDISLISEERYLAIQAPAHIKGFPADLSNKNLEYSGIYEDGWISEKSFFVLTPTETSKFISVIGSVPKIDDPAFSTVLKLSIDGREVSIHKLGLGSFELRVPVVSLKPKQRIELVFTKYQTLPGADGRIAPAKINFIGFE